MQGRVFSLLWLRREEPHWAVKEKPEGRAHKRQELSLLAGKQPPSPPRGGKGLASPGFAKGRQGSGLPGSTPTASLSWGPGRTLKSPQFGGVSCDVPSPTPCTSACSSQAAGTEQSDICLWEGDLVHQKAEFVLTESIGWFGCDGEWDGAQLAVNRASAFSPHSYCQGSNYSCTYFPIELI